MRARCADHGDRVVNVIAYYSTKIFTDAGYSREAALLVSFGSGLCNFLGAIPAIFTIDRYGRRQLLLVTFPVMAVFSLLDRIELPRRGQGCSSCAHRDESLLLHDSLLPPASAQSPLLIARRRSRYASAPLACPLPQPLPGPLNFLISFTWPEMMDKFTTTGGFYWYATWNIFGWIFAYFLVPETKGMTLEELDGVFSVRNRDHARYYAQKAAAILWEIPWPGRRAHDTALRLRIVRKIRRQALRTRG